MNLLETMFDYRRLASWAVWETNSTGDLTGVMPFPREQATAAIHGRAMFVSLNPGSDRVTESEATTPDWSNFHSANRVHNDHFLAKAIIGTPFWGSYMADLHPDIAESDSKLIRPKAEVVALKVRALISQAAHLGSVKTIVCVGASSYNSVIRHASLVEDEVGIDRNSILRIPHYSQAAAGVHGQVAEKYRALVHAALGL